jgi:hypothetical protein
VNLPFRLTQAEGSFLSQYVLSYSAAVLLHGARRSESQHHRDSSEDLSMSLQARVREVTTLPFIEADMNYLAAMMERPRNYTFDPPAGVPRSNVQNETHRVAIRDVRPIADSVSLDANGFALVKHGSAVRDFFDDEEVRRVYYPEVEEVVKAATGAYRVHIFDHTTRRRVSGVEDRRGDAPRQPVQRVHIDHTARSGPQRVRDLLPEEAEELLKGRVQVINLWRPVRGPLLDSPLAVCDATSVGREQLVPSDLVYPHRVGETYSVTYESGHRWYYVPRMRPDEALLIKCSDTSTAVPARFTPHSAFTDPTTPADAPPRESIEVRTLVFHR